MSANNRRDFFKKLFFFTSAGAIVHLMSKSFSAYAAEATLIDMSGKKRTDADNKACVATANGIGYVEDLDKALKAKKITKADKPGANNKIWKPNEQTCKNCSFYNYKKETPEKPTCMLIPQCLVHEKGSCNSWNPKA